MTSDNYLQLLAFLGVGTSFFLALSLAGLFRYFKKVTQTLIKGGQLILALLLATWWVSSLHKYFLYHIDQ